jgi:hypothetical protein
MRTRSTACRVTICPRCRPPPLMLQHRPPFWSGWHAPTLQFLGSWVQFRQFFSDRYGHSLPSCLSSLCKTIDHRKRFAARSAMFWAELDVFHVRFEVLRAVTTENAVFWDVTPCGSCKNRCFGGMYRPDGRGARFLRNVASYNNQTA